jgi:acid stress chaperone HdeB
MKRIMLVATAALLSATLSAQAQRLDVSTIKCKDFVSSSTDDIALIMMWLQGYYSAEDSSPVIDFGKMKKDAGKLGEYCGKHPDDSLITAADETLEDD